MTLSYYSGITPEYSPRQNHEYSRVLLQGTPAIVRRRPIRALGDVSAVFGLTDTAAFIWNLCDGETSCSAIVDAVLKEYEVDQEIARADTYKFLAKMKELKFII